MPMPANPKIYHIVHVNSLPSIITDGRLLCDAVIANRINQGTTIGISSIKERRLKELTLTSHPNLYVGECVPFYFCPRSVMLYLIYRGNHRDLQYHGGQEPIIHLEADLQQTVARADTQNQRWAFTLSNAGSRYFEDRCNLLQLADIDWDAVQSGDWIRCREEKQAEFLIEQEFPWDLVSRIGVLNHRVQAQVTTALGAASHRPLVVVKPEWYY